MIITACFDSIIILSSRLDAIGRPCIDPKQLNHHRQHDVDSDQNHKDFPKGISKHFESISKTKVGWIVTGDHHEYFTS